MRNGLQIYGLVMSIVLAPAFASAASLTLAWDPNPESDLAGYKVYVGSSAGSYDPPIDVGNLNEFTVSDLNVGQFYFFAVSAYDSSGNESPLSDELSAASSASGGAIVAGGNTPGAKSGCGRTNQFIAELVLALLALSTMRSLWFIQKKSGG